MYQCSSLKVAPFFNQRTPLHVAASKGRDYTVECLVEKGANISIKDKAGVSMTIFLNYGLVSLLASPGGVGRTFKVVRL